MEWEGVASVHWRCFAFCSENEVARAGGGRAAPVGRREWGGGDRVEVDGARPGRRKLWAASTASVLAQVSSLSPVSAPRSGHRGVIDQNGARTSGIGPPAGHPPSIKGDVPTLTAECAVRMGQPASRFLISCPAPACSAASPHGRSIPWRSGCCWRRSPGSCRRQRIASRRH